MDIKATSLESKVRELLSGKRYSIRVSPSAEDLSLLCVRVFGVAKADMEELEDRIFDLSDELFPHGEKTLLPMIKTPEVTREHYPDVYSELCARQWIHGHRNRRRSERDASWASAGTGSSIDDDLLAAVVVSTRNPRGNQGTWRSGAGNQEQALDAAANEQYAQAA